MLTYSLLLDVEAHQKIGFVKSDSMADKSFCSESSWIVRIPSIVGMRKAKKKKSVQLKRTCTVLVLYCTVQLYF